MVGAWNVLQAVVIEVDVMVTFQRLLDKTCGYAGMEGYGLSAGTQVGNCGL